MSTGRDSKGQFSFGNQLWKQATKSGRPRKYDNPEDLWSDCVKYFEWVENNPIYEDKLVIFQGNATHEPLAKMRAMTETGLFIFLGMSESTWYEYKANPVFSEVARNAANVIRQQKFEGAAADMLNANIIARDLGLSDKQDHTSSDRSMSPADRITVEMNPQDAANAYKDLMGN